MCLRYAILEDLAVAVKIAVFWTVAVCSLIDCYHVSEERGISIFRVADPKGGEIIVTNRTLLFWGRNMQL
jgi:hypothetical protein